MSDNILKFMPRDPLFRPSQEAEVAVKQLLRAMLPHHDSLETKMQEGIVFVDCGENHARTLCPVCGTDVGAHWSRWMSDSYRQSGFLDRMVIVPCCGARVDLNDLQYEFPMGFSSWFIEVWNPDPAVFMSVQDERLIEAALGTPVRQVLARI